MRLPLPAIEDVPILQERRPRRRSQGKNPPVPLMDSAQDDSPFQRYALLFPMRFGKKEDRKEKKGDDAAGSTAVQV